MAAPTIAARACALALLPVTGLAAQELGPCNPGEFAQQSGIPVLAAYVDAGEGLSVGRGGGGAPFVASLQGSLLWSPSAAARRWAFGPLGGFTYANPRVHGVLGARARFRALPFRISQQTDLGLGLDLFADAAWETPSAGLFGLGASLDLPLDIVVPVNGPRLFTRVLLDTDRDDVRVELGFGIRPFRRLASNPRTPEEPERYRYAISSILGAVQSAVIRGTPPDAKCDYTEIRNTASVLGKLSRDGRQRGSPVTVDTLPARLERAGLGSVVQELNRESNTWRDELARAAAGPPAVAEATALSIVAGQVVAALKRVYGVRGEP
jgi:hypothetical protein